MAIFAIFSTSFLPSSESPYFTIHAFDGLRSELESIQSLRFLFGEPRFVRSINRENTNKQSPRYNLTEQGLSLGNQLTQRRLAGDCADWIRRKVEIRSITRASFLLGKLYHIQNGKVAHAMIGSSNFPVPGLGLHPNVNNIELNFVVTDDRDRVALQAWFNSLWNNTPLVEDVKETVLRELARLYDNQSPQFIYYLTLFNIFRDFLDGTRDIDESLRRTAIPDTCIWQTLFSFQKDGSKAAMKRLGGFPHRTPPRSLYPIIDLRQHFLSFEQLNQEISALNLALYHPTARLKDDLPEPIRAMYQDMIHDTWWIHSGRP